ncbi:MAG: methyltransferase [Promethearchaeati archaeon SRVP18_Atabeyarchaeia-1]
MRILVKSVDGLEETVVQEINEKLRARELVLSPYGSRSWIRCEVERGSLTDVQRLRSITEAYVVILEEEYGESFSIDRFADKAVESIPAYAGKARRISVSAYSVRGRPSQRQIQGAFSKRIVGRLNAECNFREYDIALRVTLLKRTAIAAVNLEILPGNMPKGILTHPTPLLPPIAYFMVRLSSPQEGERLLDPMCGCGTIPLMAALEWKRLKITGADVDEEYVSCAGRNAKTLGVEDKINLLVSDVAGLSKRGLEADMIVVNPPYGMSVPAKSDLEKLCRILFEEAFIILSSRGRMAIVTPYPAIVEREASRQMFKVDSTHRIREGELPRTIQLIKKA